MIQDNENHHRDHHSKRLPQWIQQSFLVIGFLCCFLLVSAVPVVTIDENTKHRPTTRRTSLRSFISDRLNSTTNTTTPTNDTTTTGSSSSDSSSTSSGSSASVSASTPPPCIGDDSGFRKAVSKATSNDDDTKPPTIITLCDRVKISSSIKDPKYNNVTGINLSNKKIELKCGKGSTGSRCIVDGQRSSRIFYGSNTFLRVTNFDFINAYVPDGDVFSEGTVASFTNHSTVSFNQCSFRNNNGRGYGGGTVFMEDSMLTLRGTVSSPMIFSTNYQFSSSSLYMNNTRFNAVTGNIYFVNNTAEHTGAIRMIRSKASLKGIVFKNNTAEDEGAIRAEDCGSTLLLENIQFLNNRGYDYNSALKLSNCDSKIKGVTFADNLAWHRGSLTVDMSNVTLSNVTFKNNTVWEGDGADIYIADNDNPKRGGSYVSCETKTVIFCNGVGKRSIKDTVPVKNTDCMEKGITRTCK